MVFDPSVLDHMSREELIAQARVLGAERAELFTRVELRDEIVRRSATDVAERQRMRGFLGVARDLVANVVEAGLNLPETAARIRGEAPREEWRGPAPVATVTLAEIYVAQGHVERGLALLDELLEKEPDHEAARELKARLLEEAELPKRRRAEPPEPEPEPDPESVESPAAPALEVAAAPEPVPAPEVAAPEPEVSAALAAAPEAVVIAPEPEVAAAPAAAPAPNVAPAPVSQDPSLVVLSTPDGGYYAYWEIPAALLARGRVVVRVATFRTSGSSVERAVRDLAVTAARGGERLSAIDSATVVRAALGFEQSGAFTPLAVASLARVAGAGASSPVFRPRWAPERAFDALEARALAHLRGRSGLGA